MSPAPPPGRAGAALFIAGLLAIAWGVSQTPISGLDIWWHLRLGQQLLERGDWLRVEGWSWTAAGQPWAYKDGGGAIALYLGHRALGLASLQLWPALTVVAIGLSLVRRRAAGLWPLLLVLGVVAASQHRLHARPMLASFVGFAWLLRGLAALAQPSDDPERAARHAWRLVAGIAAGLWLWAQLHRGVLLGAGVASAAAVALLLRGGSPGRRTPLLTLAIVAPLMTALTPNGLAMHQTAWATVVGGRHAAHVQEWDAVPPLTLVREHGTWLALLALAALGVGRGRRDTATIGLTLLAAGLSIGALGSARWLSWAAIASGHAAAAAWPSPSVASAATGARGRQAAALLLAGALLVVVFARSGSRWPTPPGALAQGRYPVEALRFAREIGLKGPMLNDYDFGGAILWWGWPWAQVEVDGRADTIYPAQTFAAILASHRSPEAFRARLEGEPRPTWLLARNRPGVTGFPFLHREPGWCLVHWHSASTLWLRRSAHAALCDRHGFRLLRGPALDAAAFAVGSRRSPKLTRQAEAELDRMHAAPGDLRPAIARVVLHHARGAIAERDALLTTLVRAHAERPAVRALVRRLAGPPPPAPGG